jgi:hypothetical protein
MAWSMDVDTHGEYLVYLYCVTEQPPDLDGAEDRPGELYVVCEDRLYAVVSRVAASEFEPAELRRNLEDLSWVAAATTKHERIVEAVMRSHCVIPFRFATLFKTDESLRAQLREHHGQLKTLIGQLENKAEWGVKVYCDIEKLRHRVCTQDSKVSSLDEAIRSASAGKAFLLKKKREELAKAAVVAGIGYYADGIAEAFQRVSFQTRINKPLPAEAIEKRDAMILNSAFLIDKNDTDSFLEVAAALNESYAGESAVECSGPWPPYNFCDSAKQVANG